MRIKMNKYIIYIIVTYIQAVLFDTDNYTSSKARKWLKDHNFEPIKRVHKTENYLRYRIVEPNDKDIYRIKRINKYLKFIIAGG